MDEQDEYKSIAGITRAEAQQRVVTRALHEPAFRERLLRDPKGALETEFGVPLPAGYTVNVVEETPTSFYLVLPAAVDASGELSDAELESVAGGKGGKGCATSSMMCALSGGPVTK